MNDTPRVKLKRLKVNRFRTIKPGTELHFAQGINVVLGKNGTGKTTLLTLLSMVASGNFHAVREEELSVEFDFCYANHPGIWSIQVANERRTEGRMAKAQPFNPLFRVQYEANGSVEAESFVLAATNENLKGFLEYKNKKLPFQLSQYHSPFSETWGNFVNRLGMTLEDQEKLGVFVGRELLSSIPRLDEARDWLRLALDEDENFVEFGGNSHSQRLLFPSDMAHEFQGLYKPQQKPIVMIAESSAIPSLNQIVKSLGYKKGQMVLEQTSSKQERVSYGKPRFHFTKQDETVVTLDQLSFGEQRLFAFYYYLACTKDMIVADELTNGLHHEMIHGCIEAFSGRQAFLATQNPLLLDHLEFSKVEDVQAAFVLCSKETSDGQEWMAMRQMSSEEVHEFYGHYQVDLKQVNSILRWLGLW